MWGEVAEQDHLEGPGSDGASPYLSRGQDDRARKRRKTEARKVLLFSHPWLNRMGKMQRSEVKKDMDASNTFLFEVVFKDMPVLGESQARQGSDRSIIVEVEPDRIVQKVFPHPAEDDRQFAKELAPQFAMQVVQKDLPHGFEPAYSVMEIERLPGELHLCPPKFQGNRFRAWLI